MEPHPSSWIDVGGSRLETRVWPGRDPVIVLLHEGLGSVGLWRDFPGRLSAATGQAVFAWSRQGYGRSDPVSLPRPLDYMSREAALVPLVLAAAGIEDPILLGHSDGASIAALHGQGRGLILMAPHFFTEPQGLAAIADAREAYLTGNLRDRLARHHADVDGAFHGWNDAWLDPGFHDWDITGCLRGIEAPVLGIQGSIDAYGTLAQMDALRIYLADAPEIAVIEGAGHAPHLERDEAVLGRIVRFLMRL